MKRLVLLGLALITMGCDSEDGSQWAIHTDSLNFAVLIVNFDTYAFEGGTLTYYPPCDNCASDSLPMSIEVEGASDFGRVQFTYTATGDTLFAATTIWMGQGSIQYPHTFDSPESFGTRTAYISQPQDVERFQSETGFSTDFMQAATDSVWSVLSSLDIVHAFAESQFRIGYFLYPPTVGSFDPHSAKWIVFLCCANK